MDLTLLFSPLNEFVYEPIVAPNAMVGSFRLYGDKMPDYKDANIAILGVPEERGTPFNKGCKDGPDEIRKKLYGLNRSLVEYNVVDLGNLNLGVDLEETYTRLSEVCRVLLDNNVLPIILGGGHDLDYGQYQGYEGMQKLVNLVNIDAFLDMEQSEESCPAADHVRAILLHEPNYLMGYTHLAHQSYLINPSHVIFLEKLYYEAYRVGHLRSKMENMEPAIRNADMVSFDITAIRSQDAMGNMQAQPFGLTGEEACQICWYAGTNEKMSSIGFYEYNPHQDDDRKKTATVIATMVWYFIEGYYNRKTIQSFRSNDFVKYIVDMPTGTENMVFYKSKLTDRWWMEVFHPKQHMRASIVPCSYEDYVVATGGDLPDRYVMTLSRIS